MSKKKNAEVKVEDEQPESQVPNSENSVNPAKQIREFKQKLREKRKEEEQRIQQNIFGKLLGIDEGFAIRKAKEPIIFADGRTTSLEEIGRIHDILLAEAREYSLTFVSEYYSQMRRLTGYKADKKNPHHKPCIFAIYTIKYAYGRFNLKVLIRELQDRNPYLPGLNVRNFKHFQLTSEAAHEDLRSYIQDMITVMKTCQRWSQFETKYSRMYNLAFPDDLFEPYTSLT